MKKIMSICVVLGAAVVLSGCGKAKPVDNNTANDQEQSQQQASQGATEKQGFLDKLLSKGGMKCTVEQDGNTTTILTNGTKARIEGMEMPNPQDPTGAKEKGYMVNDGEWAYIWSGKQGMKFNMKEMEETAQKNPAVEDQSTKPSDWKDWAKNIESSGAKYDCSAAVVSDSDFVAPSDVQFQDMGEFLKQMQSASSSLKDVKIPEGIPQVQQ